MTIRYSNHRLNDDFSLFYEMNALSSPEALLARRNMGLIWQRRLFLKGPVFALVENKLLCHSLLVSLGIPKAEIYYGAFASKAMGEWPQYGRDDFIATLKNISQLSRDHLFVINPASGENAQGTIIWQTTWKIFLTTELNRNGVKSMSIWEYWYKRVYYPKSLIPSFSKVISTETRRWYLKSSRTLSLINYSVAGA